MKILQQYMPLKEDEKVLSSIEGNAYNTSSNIIMRFIGVMERLIAFLTGSPRKVFVVSTDKRVITIESTKMFWFFDGSIHARSYTPRSIAQVGYAFSRDLFIFKSHYLEFVSGNTSYLIKSKQGQQKVYEVINELSALVEKVSTN